MSENFTRKTLLKKLQDRHDEQAWGEFDHLYRRYIAAVLRRMNILGTDADDVIQRVLLQSWRTLPDFTYEPGKGRFRSWLAVMTRNEAKMELRRKERQTRTVPADAPEWLDPEIESMAESEWRKYVVGLAWEHVSAGLAPKVRAAYEAIQRGDEIKDVAEALQLQENSIYVYRQRVEKMICKEILRLDANLS
ncbi:MAG: hypothetical protein RL095_1078 [Verrucomicrobiota bacterium]|jgi:RNA polymerase sigma factor (sigma-70 family)